MIEHQIHLAALHDCLKYHKAVAERRAALRLAWRVELGLASAKGLSDVVLAGIVAMADCVLYNPYQRVLSEPCHAKT